ncbi:hypothetical protein F4778DRAFT_751353 [Xylariomycetidae sp. FL2044]|nr:hypothetical protein F4778DRAFT_751353 [Xylariomycetidae sp. FL2044]
MMLMPSALSCDGLHPPITRLQSALFASPPASPPPSSQLALGNIVSSCRALQSMLSAPAMTGHSYDEPASRPEQLPTPPMSYAPLPLPPLKLRLRSRKSEPAGDAIPRKRVVKRSAAPPRGVNKRRRAADDDMGRDDDIDSDLEISGSDREQHDNTTPEEAPFHPSTPKRARIAPEVIPLGLERTDFHNLHTASPKKAKTQEEEEQEQEQEGTEVEVEADGERWSKEDDRILVELVLEKLKLSKTDWQECARSLGKDRGTLGRRWKSLMVNGDVGLKSGRSRRTKIHGTWR